MGLAGVLIRSYVFVFQRARPSDGNESEGDEGERPDDDAPTIVVLKEGDLTAEEVEAERQKQTKGKSTLFCVFCYNYITYILLAEIRGIKLFCLHILERRSQKIENKI